MARGRLLQAHVTAAEMVVEKPNYCINARADGVVCNKRIASDQLYCPVHMNSPESYRDKVLFYGYLARPVRTEVVRRAFHGDNPLVSQRNLELLLDGVEKYASPDQTTLEDLGVLTNNQLLARAKKLVARLEQPDDSVGADVATPVCSCRIDARVRRFDSSAAPPNPHDSPMLGGR
jgi:hypothetical protein